MSEPLYTLGGLRFWSEEEIQLREAFTRIAVAAVRRELLAAVGYPIPEGGAA